MRFQFRHFTIAAFCLTSLIIASCESIESEAKYPTGYDRTTTDGDIYSKPASIFGDGGLKLLGDKKEDADDGSSGIGVNSFLWRASLDTVSFMPLASADPFGGVILTDWYMPDAEKNERFKVNVFILGRRLRSDGVRVRLFKQVKKGGAWVDGTIDKETALQMEDTILTRARQLRVSSLQNEE